MVLCQKWDRPMDTVVTRLRFMKVDSGCRPSSNGLRVSLSLLPYRPAARPTIFCPRYWRWPGFPILPPRTFGWCQPDALDRASGCGGTWGSGIARKKGISTPSAVWMKALLEAQRNGNPIQANNPSLHANQLPSPPYTLDTFPGHSAWIDGDLKLHRIESATSDIRWELYDLAKDPSRKNGSLE